MSGHLCNSSFTYAINYFVTTPFVQVSWGQTVGMLNQIDVCTRMKAYHLLHLNCRPIFRPLHVYVMIDEPFPF